jgi:catechol 2,3-dioxygenase-like lactoylglutathione lyase family enzyme
MLEKVDGVLLAVRDAEAATRTFASLFGTEVIETRTSDFLNAEVTDLACGVDRIGLAVPRGAGLVATHVDRWGEGLIGVAFATRDVLALKDRMASRGIQATPDEEDGFFIDPSVTHGLLTRVVPSVDRERAGVPSFIYEVTHLVRDWPAVSKFWTEIFGLDEARFSPIASEQYGYEGMLTLFDPPGKLDRIEVVYPHDTNKAMGRFFVKRGEGPYMFFMETDDMPALRARLKQAGARFAPEREPEQPNSLFVHPSSAHGVLIGVSPRNLAWVWSGRPELARAQN